MKKARIPPGDILALDYNEVWALEYVMESFLSDNEGDSFTLGTEKRQEFFKQILAKLEAFTDIDKRCGSMGPPASNGDYPRCTRRPHSDTTLHTALDEEKNRVMRWHGDRAGEYLSDVVKPPQRSKGEVY